LIIQAIGGGSNSATGVVARPSW